MPSWSDLGNVWTTLRELDVNAIRAEADKPLFIACVGEEPLLNDLGRLLHGANDRYPGVGIDPIGRFGLDLDSDAIVRIERADVAILVLDARQSTSALATRAFEQLAGRGAPLLVVLLYGTTLPSASGAFSSVPSVAIPDINAPDAADTLAQLVLERLPEDLRLSAARRLPGLRATVAKELVNSVSFSNATYALASGLPEQIPVLNVPFAAADILVLTKNQALLVYKLALAYGAPPDFQSRIKEVLPVVGGAYLWRQVARSLIGLIPVWGLVPKVAVAYAGTYSTGVAAWRWYANGELVNSDQFKQISQEAMNIGKARARELLNKMHVQQKDSAARPGLFKRLGSRVRAMLPGGKKRPALPAPQENSE